MSNNKKSETLMQREKAQRDLLELKKMQRGDISTDTLHEGDEPILPQTFEEKKANFLFYHKYKLIAGILAFAVLAFLIYNTATKVKYDAKMVLFCFDYYTDDLTTKSSDFFEGFYDDLNGNGKVDLLTVNCSFDQRGKDAEYAKTMLTKVQVLLIGENDTMLYLLDKDALEFLNGVSDSVQLFDDENILKLGKNYFGALGTEEKELYLCLRTVDGTTLEGKAKESYEAARQVFERVSLANVSISENQN